MCIKMAMQMLPCYLNLFSKPRLWFLSSAIESAQLGGILKARVAEPQQFFCHPSVRIQRNALPQGTEPLPALSQGWPVSVASLHRDWKQHSTSAGQCCTPAAHSKIPALNHLQDKDGVGNAVSVLHFKQSRSQAKPNSPPRIGPCPSPLLDSSS